MIMVVMREEVSQSVFRSSSSATFPVPQALTLLFSISAQDTLELFILSTFSEGHFLLFGDCFRGATQSAARCT